MDTNARITKVTGTALPLRGNDIDTDRIIPARYLKCVVFNELGPHAFEDDRLEAGKKGEVHPFDNEAFRRAGLLFVNGNFGCGSSREHAPQSLMRWGIKAIVGESFAEIFFGNCVSLGIPCAVLPHSVMERIQSLAEQKPDLEWTLDVEKKVLTGKEAFNLEIAEGPRTQFLSGTWNPLQGLLENRSEIQKVAAVLPYISGF